MQGEVEIIFDIIRDDVEVIAEEMACARNNAIVDANAALMAKLVNQFGDERFRDDFIRFAMNDHA